jgi:hypothetical protein
MNFLATLALAAMLSLTRMNAAAQGTAVALVKTRAPPTLLCPNRASPNRRRGLPAHHTIQPRLFAGARPEEERRDRLWSHVQHLQAWLAVLEPGA